jgi:hypothetical protein
MFRDNQTTNVGIFGLNSKDMADLPMIETPKAQEVITKIVDNSVDN